MEKIKMSNEYKYQVWVDRGTGVELAAWYDSRTAAQKEVDFLKGKGYKSWYTKGRSNING